MKKTAPINLMISVEDKKKLQDKARNLNLTLTSYIEKISREPIIFLDSNSKLLLESLKLKT